MGKLKTSENETIHWYTIISWNKKKLKPWEKKKHSIQNLWNMAKEALREKFITINIYIKKRSHVHNLTACIKN